MVLLTDYTALTNLYTVQNDPDQFVSGFIALHQAELDMLKQESNSRKFSFRLQHLLTVVYSVESLINLAQSLHTNCPSLKAAVSKIAEYHRNIYQTRSLGLAVNKAYYCAKGKALTIIEHYRSLFTESFLSKDKKAEYASLNAKIAALESKFSENFELAKKGTYIHIFSLKDFDPLPTDLIEAAASTAKRHGKRGYWFDLTANSYAALISNCKSSRLRAYIYKTYVGLAATRTTNNEPVLRELIYLRSVLAKNYGYDSYTEYATDHSSLSSVDDVLSFLTAQRYVNEPSYIQYKKELAEFSTQQLGMSRICPWDYSYVRNKFDDHYFTKSNLDGISWSISRVFSCIADLITQLFGIKLVIEQNLVKWKGEPLVAKFYKNNTLIGNLVLDIAANSTKHQVGAYAMCVCDYFQPNGEYAPSGQVIVMNIPTSEGKLCLNHAHVVELFHEFGHVLHVLLTDNKSIAQNHANLESDAMEFPSQWFECFASKPEFIKKMGRIKGKPLSHKQALAVEQYKNLHRPAYYWYSMINSEIDFVLNAGGASAFTKRSIHETISGVYTAYGQFLPKYNKLPNNQLNHFFMGSLYYGYLWTEQMVEHWNNKHSDLPLAEQGEKLSAVLNQSLKKSIVKVMQRQ